MKQSKKIMLYSLLGMLAIGIFFAVSNVSAEETTLDTNEGTCDGSGTPQHKQNRHGQGTGEGPQDGTGNGKRHQYNATLNENGECINAIEA